jgi:hypothetical protein
MGVCSGREMGLCCGTELEKACGNLSQDDEGVFETDKQIFIQRDQKYYYDIVFPSRPLYITVTSDKNNIDAYFTDVDERCPAHQAQEKIVVGSKAGCHNYFWLYT